MQGQPDTVRQAADVAGRRQSDLVEEEVGQQACGALGVRLMPQVSFAAAHR